MDPAALRALLRPHVVALSATATHKTLPDIWRALGMPVPDGEGSKHDRMVASFDALPDGALESVAVQFLRIHSPDAAVRNVIQDALWGLRSTLALSKRHRREVARAIDGDVFLDAHQFEQLLDALFVLDDDPLGGFFGNSSNSLRTRINRHVFRNPGDWSAEMLFEQIGALDASDARFARFIEALAGPDVRPDEPSQRAFVDVVNKALHRTGLALRETDTRDGYPVFSLLRIDATDPGRPKNLIFASSAKPDLRFRDAVNNDIEIVSNADKVLVYDRPISGDGLRWSDLQAWWSDFTQTDDVQKAKDALYRRLRASLPQSSPPQQLFFESYFRVFAPAIPRLPALLPEVWLHWDPHTVEERGREALLRSRMDFLLLLPAGVRVVVEVDGKQHYAEEERASPVKYAALVAADRELQLRGYNVFRFGADELRDATAAHRVVKAFFTALFRKQGVTA